MVLNSYFPVDYIHGVMHEIDYVSSIFCKKHLAYYSWYMILILFRCDATISFLIKSRIIILQRKL
jgi:hypothetical protein